MGQTFRKAFLLLLMLCSVLLLAACGGTGAAQTQKTPVPTATPAAGRGQQLLDQTAHLLDSAQTLHGVFRGTISGQLANGNVGIELWHQAPVKSRTLVLQSTLSQFASGSLIVDNGKKIWQYDPTKKVVYTGSASSSGTATGTATPGTGQGNIDQLLFGIIQTIFDHSNATLLSSSSKVNGRPVYVLQVSPQTGSGSTAGFTYTGTVSIDQQTHLPLALNLTLQGFGQVQLTVPSLILNGSLPDSLFTFTPPPGTKVLPLPSSDSTTGGGSLTLQQAEQQAGYHLLSIPQTQSAYHLESIDALGAPGNQIYTLNYVTGSQSFTISEGKSLANLPVSGSKIKLRGTTTTFSSTGGTGTLSWTEQGIGIQISGSPDKTQLVAIAQLLA